MLVGVVLDYFNYIFFPAEFFPFYFVFASVVMRFFDAKIKRKIVMNKYENLLIRFFLKHY